MAAKKKAKKVSAKPKGDNGQYPPNVDKKWEKVVYDVSGAITRLPFDVGRGIVRGARGAVYQTVGRPTNAKPTLGVPNPNAKSTARRKSGGGSASRKK
jgi:hypothetical protein